MPQASHRASSLLAQWGETNAGARLTPTVHAIACYRIECRRRGLDWAPTIQVRAGSRRAWLASEPFCLTRTLLCRAG